MAATFTPPRKLVVLGCSALTHGEFFLALEFAQRCSNWQTVALGPIAQRPVAERFGLTFIAFSALPGVSLIDSLARQIIKLAPDVLLIADWHLFCGNSPDFGAALYPLLKRLPSHLKVIAHDLYAWNQRGEQVDPNGAPSPNFTTRIPKSIGRLSPSPYLPPSRSVAGHGRYLMLKSEARRPQDYLQARQELGFDEGPLLFIATSPWQQLSASPQVLKIQEHFPRLVGAYLAMAAEKVGRVSIVHLGPVPFAASNTEKFHYQHFEPGKANFQKLMQACDVFLSLNCLATSVIQAAMMRIPTVCVHLDSLTPGHSGSPAQQVFNGYVKGVEPSYPLSVWPIGLHGFCRSILQDNPWGAAQLRLDAAQPDQTVALLTALISGAQLRQAISASQERYFSGLRDHLDAPETALELALQ